jgi:hypothetical protein
MRGNARKFFGSEKFLILRPDRPARIRSTSSHSPATWKNRRHPDPMAQLVGCYLLVLCCTKIRGCWNEVLHRRRE